MKLQAQCEHCGATFLVKEEAVGRKGRCPRCKAVFDVTGTLPIEQDTPASTAKRVPPCRATRRQARVSARAVSLALIAACVVAVAGAVAWAAIAHATRYELGYLAWGIGALVGLAAVRLGGRGMSVALACAGLSLAAIIGGKLLAFSWVLDTQLDEAVDSFFTRDRYVECRDDARDFAGLPPGADDERMRYFMFEHGFSDSEPPSRITDDQVDAFRAIVVPELIRFQADDASFEQWRAAGAADFRRDVAESGPLLSYLNESLDLYDIIFAFLGVGTAFGIVIRGGLKDEEEERPRRRRSIARPRPPSAG